MCRGYAAFTVRRTLGNQWASNGVARQFLAQKFKLKPLRLGGLNLPVQIAERCRGLLESGTIARVILRVVELGLQLGGLRPERRDGRRKRLERVLVLECHAPPGWLRIRAGRSRLICCLVGLWRRAVLFAHE